MRCISGKRSYPTQEVAEDSLLEAWGRFEFQPGNGPVAVYRCEDCGLYHLTSAGPMNERLATALKDGSIGLQREAKRWEDKFKRR